MPDTWRDIAARKQDERNARIPEAWRLPESAVKGRLPVSVPRECGLLTQHELRLTENYDATALLAALAGGRLTSAAVTAAFCKRAAIAQQTTNCLTEIFFDAAMARAAELDADYARTGTPTGPLHGLPVSLKDSFRVQGYDASIGIASLCFRPATENAALVDMLLAMGAVLYCKTNVPQTLMALDSHNNVFGRTLNPALPHLTPGGSSGGEGALLAMRGSPLGIGTDVGGSIRIPAMCNGLYGLKPSHGRVPYAGQESATLPGSSKLGLESTAGPMATSMRDCTLFLRIVADAAPWLVDPDCLPQSWHQQPPLPATTPLRVGIAYTDGLTTPLPPIQTLMSEISTTLSRTPGIQVTQLDLTPLLTQCLKVFNAHTSIDGANSIFDALDSTAEPLSPWLQNRLTRRAPKTLPQVRALQATTTALRTQSLQIWLPGGGYWKQASARPDADATAAGPPLDLILMPVAPHPVPQTDAWNTVSYTSCLNLLDLPAGTLPVRVFHESDMDGEVPDGKPLNGWDSWNRGLWDRDARSRYLGSWLGVQVVAPRLQERRLAEGMAVLEAALAGLGGRAGRL